MNERRPFVWFDFGGVLSPPLPVLFRSYADRTGISPDVLRAAMAAVGDDYSMPALAPLELGIIDERSWVRELHAAISRAHPDIDLSRSELDFGRQWFDGHSVNEPVRRFALELIADGIDVGVLSNNVIEWEPYWRSMIGIDDVVTDLIDSCRVGMRKPDPAIFELAARRNDVDPEDCILVDDLEENCVSARRSGWTAVRFVDADQAVGDVGAALQRVRHHRRRNGRPARRSARRDSARPAYGLPSPGEVPMSTPINPAPVRFDIRDIAGIVPDGMIVDHPAASRGGLPQVVLPSGHVAVHATRYDDVHRVLTDASFLRGPANVADGPSFLPTIMPEDMLLNLDHPRHGRLKRFVAAAYSANTIGALAPVVRGRVESAVDDLARPLDASADVDLMAELLDPLTISVNAGYLGIPARDIPVFRHLSRRMQLAHDTDVPGLLADFGELYRYIEDLIAGRRALDDGLVTGLLAARDTVAPPVTDAEYAAILLGSLVGGDQNVLSVLAKVVYVALAERALWELMVDSPAVIPDVVEELLRLLPLGRISTFPRIASQRVVLSGGVVHEGEVVYADAHEANRDPSVFPDPWLIDTARVGRRHLQFGYGMHHCMGSALARTVIVETVTVLTARLPGLRLAAPPEAIAWDTGVLVHRPLGLPVRVTDESYE
ncbi:HAD-IA family hydrolase [Tsukamurella sp. NPDC003166]|uniref:HAD-IA family hydrolase n=1 Tax=Tsukamurella sp. NPDC003166 TaxID=3154444 RepID=UPI0033A2F3BB